MGMLIDSGFLYAVWNKKDKHHQRVVAFLNNLSDEDMEQIVLPTLALVEMTYLIREKLGHPKMREFVESTANAPFQLEPLEISDLTRVHEILAQYADAELDFVDAFIIALAERLKISKILTVDRRDFGMVRPKHCDYFEILP